MTQKSKTKFSAGDKVVALKGFHTIKIGDILTVENPDQYCFQATECRGFTLNVANYELYKPKFKNMKFKVKSPEHSKEIQEALFEMGYKWGVGGSQGAKIMNTETPTLYTYDDGSIMYDSSDYESEYRMFNKSENQEHTIETTKSYKLIPVEIPKPETITIDGKTYDKEAVLKRLAELEVVK